MKRVTQPVRRNIPEAHKFNAADCMTSLRIAASLFLLFLSPGSTGFFAVYTLAGLTDALDGWLARKTGTASSFGARLDSTADLLFYCAVLIWFIPVLRQTMPAEIWYAVAGILFVRLASYGTAAIKYHRFASLHTRLNKLTGAAVFLLPYILTFSSSIAYCRVICALVFAASLEELAIHLYRERYCADIRSIFQMENEQCG